MTVYCREKPAGLRAWNTEGVHCIWTPGRDSKSASTLSFGLSAHLDAANRDFDAALILNIANGFFLPLLARKDIPTALNTDGLEWKRGKWGPVAKRVFYRSAQLSAKHADILVSDSEAISDVWESEFSVRPRFIPYGGDVVSGLGSERVNEMGLESGSYCLSVARLIPENNVELTLDAVDGLAHTVPTVIVGSANYRSPLEDRLKDLVAQGRAIWLGHVHDQALLAELWANAGVYVHGHSVGGTNPALLQALGFGAPTLALDTVFNREVLRDDQRLYPADPVELGRRIESVVSNRAMQRTWGAAGQAIVDSRYRWDDVCDGYEQVLRDAIKLRAE